MNSKTLTIFLIFLLFVSVALSRGYIQAAATRINAAVKSNPNTPRAIWAREIMGTVRQ